MEDKTPENVSYTVYETAQARADRRLKWMWILVVIMFVALIGTNGAWLYHESQYQDEVTTIEATQEGSAVNIVGGGDIKYGAESKDNEDTKSP